MARVVQLPGFAVELGGMSPYQELRRRQFFIDHAGEVVELALILPALAFAWPKLFKLPGFVVELGGITPYQELRRCQFFH